jgi:hypothetical protein
MKEKKERVSSLIPISSNWYYTLKIFAIATMIIYCITICPPFSTMIPETAQTVMQMIGEISVPIFAYELVECFHYTKSRKKHLLKLFLLMVISEPLRDFAVDGVLNNIEKQSICCDFFLSWIMLIVMSVDFKKLFKDKLLFKSERYVKMLSNHHRVMVGVVFCFIGAVIMCNYDFKVVMLVGFLELAYHSNHKRVWQTVYLAIYILMFQEKAVYYILVIVDIVLILIAETQTKKKKYELEGKQITDIKPIKWICTVAYPLQFLVFSIIRLVTV